ncbi:MULTISPECIES: MFS transporter [Streptomyces]|uniref:MFS transporter n=1 Tax=Streptomyces herbicida TaxID=3065675 RepID=UPI0029319D50|nr:MFS transporter [Streptomyces sp. NEAU-HV9]
MISRTVRTVAGLPAPLRALFFTTLIFRTGTMAYPFLAAHLLVHEELSKGTAGTILACFGVGALAADLAASVLLGRVSARALMLGGLVLNAAVLIMFPFLHGPAPVVASVVVWGFAYEIVTPAAYSATVAAAGPEERKIAFSCYRLAVNLGMAAGPVVGGLLFTVDARLVFWTNAGCALAAAGHLSARTRGTPATAPPRQSVLKRGTVRRTPYERARFWTIFGLSLPVQLAYSLPSVFVSTYVIVALGLPGYWAGVVFAVNAVGIVLFEVPLNVLMARTGHLPTLLLGYGLAGTGFLLMALSGSGPSLVLSTLVWTAGEIVVFPGLLGYVSDLSGEDSADRNLSLYSTGVNIAFILAPHLALLLSRPTAPGIPWAVAGGALCVAWLLLTAARSSPYTWHTEDPSCTDAI